MTELECSVYTANRVSKKKKKKNIFVKRVKLIVDESKCTLYNSLLTICLDCRILIA